MINPLCKFALCALGPLLITAPAAAADLIPYNNGYIPEQREEGGAYPAAPGYGPSGNYGAESYYCDPNGEAPEGGLGACVPGHPYPGVLPNGRYGPYAYQGSYGAGPPPSPIGPNDRYGEYSDRPGYPPATPPSERYGDYSSQPRYGPNRTPPVVAPDGYSGQRGYGPDRTPRYGGYPAQGGDPSAQPSYRPGSIPPPAANGENPNPNGYGPDHTAARYGGYPSQGGYGPDRLPTPVPQRGYESGPPPAAALPPNDPYSY